LLCQQWRHDPRAQPLLRLRVHRSGRPLQRPPSEGNGPGPAYVQPLAKTHSCEAPHFQYHVSGKLAIRMDDGTEFVAGPGDVTALPSGHDAWVVGDEPVVVVDWFGASNYGRAV
jgi:hypothetical protein